MTRRRNSSSPPSGSKRVTRSQAIKEAADESKAPPTQDKTPSISRRKSPRSRGRDDHQPLDVGPHASLAANNNPRTPAAATSSKGSFEDLRQRRAPALGPRKRPLMTGSDQNGEATIATGDRDEGTATGSRAVSLRNPLEPPEAGSVREVEFSDFKESMSQIRSVLTAILAHTKPHTASVPRVSISPSVWGNLISEYEDQPHAQLVGSTFTIGRSSRCNLQLNDPNLSGLVCRVHYNGGSPLLESCTSSSSLSLNGQTVRKGQRVALCSGDQVAFSGFKGISFVYQQIARDAQIEERDFAREVPIFFSEKADDSPMEAVGGIEVEDIAKMPSSYATPTTRNTLAPQQLGPSSTTAVIEKTKGNIVQGERSKEASRDSEPLEGPTARKVQEEDGQDAPRVELAEASPPRKRARLSSGSTSRASPRVSTASRSPADGERKRKDTDSRGSGKSTPEPVAAVVLTPRVDPPPTSNPDGATSASTVVAEMSAKFQRMFEKLLISPEDLETSFDKFPYYLPKETKELLIGSTFPFLKAPDFLKYTQTLRSLNRCILLLGPAGTELYQDLLVKALCKELGVHLICFDPELHLEEIRADDVATPAGAQRSVKPAVTQGERRQEANSKPPRGILGTRKRSLGEITGRTNSTDGLGKEKVSDGWNVQTGGSAAGCSASSFKVGDRVVFLGSSRGRSAGGEKGLGPSLLQGRAGNGRDGCPSAAGRLRVISSRSFEPLRGPSVGAKGTVVLVFPENPAKVGVEFDISLPGGHDLGGLCSTKNGFFVKSSELGGESLSLLSVSKETLFLESLLKVALGVESLPMESEDQRQENEKKDVSLDSDSKRPRAGESGMETPSLGRSSSKAAKSPRRGQQKGKKVERGSQVQYRPCVIFVREAESALISNVDLYFSIKRQLSSLPVEVPLVIIAGCVHQPIAHADLRREKVLAGPPGIVFAKPSGATSLLDLPPLFEAIHRPEERSRPSTTVNKFISSLFPTSIEVHPPRGGKDLDDWKEAIARDVEKLRCRKNISVIKQICAQSRLDVSSLPEAQLRDCVFTKEEMMKIVSLAVSHQLRTTKQEDLVLKDDRLVLSPSSLASAILLHYSLRAQASLVDESLKDIVTDGEFEKRLLQEAVIPKDEITVRFEDVGALETVKSTLHELVLLPLQRPELFRKGQLTAPVKGILLFGPPGTGKTMLAKAVAGEAGAHFISITMSNIASKWFGEGEKFVKAVFSLASKIAPAVIFIDEVDSLLGKREKQGEHEAMRKMKNEFMSNWDGLRTKANERVLVLAATNRPFDLDDAVLRRFPRRIMVDLPNSEQREKILRVILKKEDLNKGFSFTHLAADDFTGGYSGSDLKNLCIAAAYQPIRELLRKEREGPSAPGGPSGKGGVGLSATADGRSTVAAEGHQLRPITIKDFEVAKKEVSASMSEDSFSMQEIRKWNEMYGEGGSRKPAILSYFM